MARRWSSRPPWPPSTTMRSGPWAAATVERQLQVGGVLGLRVALDRGPAARRPGPAPPRRPSRSRRRPGRRGARGPGPGRRRSRRPPPARRPGGPGAARPSSASPPVTTTIVLVLRVAIRADSLRRHYPVQVPGSVAPSRMATLSARLYPSSPSCWRHRTAGLPSSHAAHPLRRRARPVPRVGPRLHRRRRSRPTTRRGKRAGIVDRRCSPRPARSGSWAWPSPRSYGGGGVDDFRYNVVIAEEIQRAGVNAAGLGLDAAQRHLPAVLPHAVHRRAEGAVAAGHLLRRADHRHRDDRARHRVRPRVDDHHRRPRRRPLRRQRVEDLHHQRHQRRPRDHRGEDRPDAAPRRA